VKTLLLFFCFLDHFRVNPSRIINAHMFHRVLVSGSSCVAKPSFSSGVLALSQGPWVSKKRWDDSLNSRAVRKGKNATGKRRLCDTRGTTHQNPVKHMGIDDSGRIYAKVIQEAEEKQ
jgi:hypothetical protein